MQFLLTSKFSLKKSITLHYLCGDEKSCTSFACVSKMLQNVYNEKERYPWNIAGIQFAWSGNLNWRILYNIRLLKHSPCRRFQHDLLYLSVQTYLFKYEPSIPRSGQEPSPTMWQHTKTNGCVNPSKMFQVLTSSLFTCRGEDIQSSQWYSICWCQHIRSTLLKAHSIFKLNNTKCYNICPSQQLWWITVNRVRDFVVKYQ